MKDNLVALGFFWLFFFFALFCHLNVLDNQILIHTKITQIMTKSSFYMVILFIVGKIAIQAIKVWT